VIIQAYSRSPLYYFDSHVVGDMLKGYDACSATQLAEEYATSKWLWPEIGLGTEGVMPITIFHTENGSTETWLEVNDDGTVTYYEENSGRKMLRRGIEPRNRVMTTEEAKSDWTSYARDIDEASSAIASRRDRTPA
jgi:hypothetical protein